MCCCRLSVVTVLLWLSERPEPVMEAVIRYHTAASKRQPLSCVKWQAFHLRDVVGVMTSRPGLACRTKMPTGSIQLIVDSSLGRTLGIVSGRLESDGEGLLAATG